MPILLLGGDLVRDPLNERQLFVYKRVDMRDDEEHVPRQRPELRLERTEAGIRHVGSSSTARIRVEERI